VVVPDGNDGKVLVHRNEILVGSILIVPTSIVVETGNLGVLGGLSSDGSTASTVLVDVVAEVDDVVGVLVHHGARVRREEAATVG
jgi:uncharacterized protein (DUF342 family)